MGVESARFRALEQKRSPGSVEKASSDDPADEERQGGREVVGLGLEWQ